MSTKDIILGIITLVVIGGGGYYYTTHPITIPGGDSTSTTTHDFFSPPTNGNGQTSNSKPGTTIPTPTPAKGGGRVVVTLSDDAVGLDTLQSLVATVSEISISGPGGWTTILKGPRAFDLLDLYKTGHAQLVLDTTLAPGNYNQLRFVFANVIVIQKEGLKSVEAKIPSKELRMNIKLNVQKGDVSALSIDVLSSKALHRTIDGTFLFYPVLALEGREKVGKVQITGKNVELFNGATSFTQTFGVNENNILTSGFSFPAGTRMEVVGDALRIIPSDEKPNETRASAQAAITKVVSEKYLDKALSVQISTRGGERVWHITGTKGGVLTKVYVSITSGNIVASE